MKGCLLAVAAFASAFSIWAATPKVMVVIDEKALGTISTSEIEGCRPGDASSREESADKMLAKLSFAFDFWRAEKVKLEKIAKKQSEENKITQYEKKKISLLEKIRAGKPDVSFDEFDRIINDRVLMRI